MLFTLPLSFLLPLGALLLRKTVRQLITLALTAPFTWLVSLFIDAFLRFEFA